MLYFVHFFICNQINSNEICEMLFFLCLCKLFVCRSKRILGNVSSHGHFLFILDKVTILQDAATVLLVWTSSPSECRNVFIQ